MYTGGQNCGITLVVWICLTTTHWKISTCPVWSGPAVMSMLLVSGWWLCDVSAGEWHPVPPSTELWLLYISLGAMLDVPCQLWSTCDGTYREWGCRYQRWELACCVLSVSPATLCICTIRRTGSCVDRRRLRVLVKGSPISWLHIAWHWLKVTLALRHCQYLYLNENKILK